MARGGGAADPGRSGAFEEGGRGRGSTASPVGARGSARGGGALDEPFEPPATTRIGPSGGSGRGLRVAVGLVVAGLALAVLKPWDWLAGPAYGPAPAPGREGAAIASLEAPPTPTASVATSRPSLFAGVACLSDQSWMAVVDAVDGPTMARSWTRLDAVAATDPTDPSMARTHLYAESVPRIGFCAPVGARTADSGSGADPIRFRVWRLVHPSGAPATVVALGLDPPVAAGGTLADRGVMLGAPEAVASGGVSAASPDPEGAWSVGGGLAPRPAGWSPAAPVSGEPAPWPPGSYVFRVDLPGAGPSGADATWFAIDLRGPWPGPAPSPASAPASRPAGTPGGARGPASPSPAGAPGSSSAP